MLPGSWFHSDGQLVRFLVGTNKLTTDADLALQIWRPTCSTGALDSPGCNSNSPFFTCTSSGSPTCSTNTCPEGSYLCLLSQSCMDLNQPCTCAGLSSVIPAINCSSQTVSSSLPAYELINSWVVRVPAGTARIQFKPSQATDVQFGDILGFQTSRNDLVRNEASSSSQWRNAAMSRSSTADWLSVTTLEDSTAYSMSFDVLSDVSAVFTEVRQTSSPGPSLGYITAAGDYTFTSSLKQTSLGTCTVSVIDAIAGFLWIFPEPTQTTIIQGSTSTAVVKVASDQTMNLVVKVLKGTNPIVSWTFSGSPTQVSSSLQANCPTSISPVPESCGYSSSFLSEPYAVL
ncbi:hypothetical protein EGW08_020250, partial [Elysia chlorotica]